MIENDIDISKIQLDNKMHNVEFLLKSSIFKILAQSCYSITDMSQAYVPWISNESSPYVQPCAENNYADLSFINCGEYYNIKACRIKTFKAIPMDGNILTYAENTINHRNFIVFYSINPNEANKIFLIDTDTYNFLTSRNSLSKIRYFDVDNLERLRQNFGLKKEWISFIDYTQENMMEDAYEKNVEIKRIHCLNTLIKMQKYKESNNNKIIWHKTHYGKQYSAYNIITKEIRQFRDCQARNNFFKSIGIKLPNNHIITRNCKNMNRIITEKKSDSYKINLHDGWVIMDYIPSHEKLIDCVKELIITVYNKSKRVAEKIKNFMSKCKENFVFMTNTATIRIRKMKNRLKKNLEYIRPLSLYNFITKSENVNMNLYFERHDYLKRQFA